MNKRQNIGQRIKERRKEMKITQIEIKRNTGISTGNMSDIENGKSLPSAIAIIELSRILNCTTDWILTGEIPNSDIKSNDAERELLSLFRMLPYHDQKEILELMEFKLTRLKKLINQKEKVSFSAEETAHTETV